MSLNYGAGEDSWESLGQQGHQTSQLVMPAPINQPWIFLGRTDAEAEAPILVPPDAKSQLTGKDPDAGKDWRQEKKGMTEDEMVGWHHQLREHEFEQTPGDSKTQPGVQQSRGLPSVRQDWGTEQLSPRRYSMKPALWTKTLVQPLASPLVFSLPNSPSSEECFGGLISRALSWTCTQKTKSVGKIVNINSPIKNLDNIWEDWNSVT